MRDFDTYQGYADHSTGRLCDDQNCRGPLFDTIINFGENLNSRVLNRAWHEADRSDLCLAMGSSLRVTPAADIPLKVAQNGQKLVIVNLQKTPLDNAAAMVIHAMCDTVMDKVMTKLNLEIPRFQLHRKLRVTKYRHGDKERIQLQGLDIDESPYTLFT
jgi:NAD-dependent SIR2 family protein deacetylase